MTLPALARQSVLDTLTLASESVVRVENAVQGIARTSAGKLKIMRYASEGGGFIIDESGVIATNGHVVKGKGRVSVIFRDGSKKTAQIIGRSDRYDLAFLKMESGKKLKALRFSKNPTVRLHDKVYATGTSSSLSGTLSQGQITGFGIRKDFPGGPLEIIQVNFNAYHGDSGSPIFDSEGNLLGMTTASLKKVSHVTYAIPASYIQEAYTILKTKSGRGP